MVGATISSSARRFQFGGQHARRAVRAHPAGIGAGIAVADALVVLRRSERHHRRAVGQHEQADFLALEEFLDHRARRRGSANSVSTAPAASAIVIATVTPLPAARPSAFTTTGAPNSSSAGARLVERMHRAIAGGRDVRAVAQRLGERLRSFELRGRLARPEHREPGGAQIVGDPRDQRRFGPDHDQIDRVRAAEIDHRRMVASRRARPVSASSAIPGLPGAA